MKKILIALVIVSSLSVFISQFIASDSIAYAQDTSNITVQTIEDESISTKILNSLTESWPWYITRATGLIAAITLVILMLSGIGQITGHSYKLLDPIVSWASHRALGILFGVSVLVHVFSLLFDKFININILDILVPWWSDFREVEIFGINFGSIYLALGIIAFYLSIIIVVTSLTIISKKPYFWKMIHLLSYLVILFVFFHALYIGTDLSSGWLRIAWIVGGLIILISSIVRLRRAFTS